MRVDAVVGYRLQVTGFRNERRWRNERQKGEMNVLVLGATRSAAVGSVGLWSSLGMVGMNACKGQGTECWARWGWLLARSLA
jgi:hypothetical protein